MTPSDIYNQDRISGYDHVQLHKDDRRRKRYRARSVDIALTKRDKRRMGPWRATAYEAALDYCAWNALNILAPAPKLKSAGHTSIKTERTSVSAKKVEAYALLAEASAEEDSDPSGFIYCISDGTALKIGKSAGHPQNRLKGLQTGNPRLLSLLAYRQVPDCRSAEVQLHVKYQELNLLGEWFAYDEAILDEFVG